ncbi:hypothetical protein CPC735_026820 [Coccidioides posadasii C735 delta SOWgp]|uniref:Uncharacterized protein n=1 Tax=Coccidioides posadasii (strain C735) TaxID=222929 RepID=C5P7E6_COCP7|nr:hypothetical protein CPC735_026820 [Coccidioides posadasii C735 delta SOWgp]EER27346.1 hypothetical protein CPC735_026820 [Coccidioides posadasii C735 delta SOWgp]|eukprot:XP_003069491.1 hypothetical protein CPC735_026820 [Coccidioides posadasii C735 delta SOWgp]
MANMANTHTEDTAFAFRDEDFILEDYSDYPHGFCSLQIENLFPRARFPMLRKETPVTDNAYTLIEPALLLASRIIIQRWESLRIFVRRQHHSPIEGWLDSGGELELSKDEVISQVKNVMPDIDFDPDMEPNSCSFAQTTLRPNVASDLIVLDYNLIRLLKDCGPRDSQKLAALFFLAVLLCHELAHVLEFQCIHEGRLRPDGKPFETPPGITCREAGTGWETRAFGGRIYPVCKAENSLLQIRGICINSSAWNFEMMKVNESWIRRLFSDEHWIMDTHPLRPPIDVYVRHAFLEDELLDRHLESPLKRKMRGSDVHVEMQSPTKKRRVIETMKICGRKKVKIGY